MENECLWYIPGYKDRPPVPISAFFSVCVKVKTQADYRAFCTARLREAFLRAQAGAAFLPSRHSKSILKEFGKCVKGAISLPLN